MTIDFEEFPKIPRLKRECVISEKIDGAFDKAKPCSVTFWKPFTSTPARKWRILSGCGSNASTRPAGPTAAAAVKAITPTLAPIST